KGLRPAAELSAVVKANAYGLGVHRVGPALLEAGCQIFFVAYAFEGTALRQLIGPDAKICIFNGPDADNITDFYANRLTPVLNTAAQIDLWERSGGDTPAMLHVDTGMNRLGLSPDEATQLAAKDTGLTISHILSHFSCSDDPEAAENTTQLARFQEARETLHTVFPEVQHSISASGGLFLPHEIEENLTRPGLALYGICPQVSLESALKTVAQLEAPVLQVRELKPGDPVGYGSTYRANKHMQVATIALGYGDGYSRALSGKGEVMLANTACPILGIVSMDLITVDISNCSEEVKIGDMAECFGHTLNIEKVAANAGTIPYELLVTLGDRVKRVYTD
ncbi:MAG: alanine racemase, partial [Aquisalinus sp.]|nr:alanine racemase [Aquisalinus sp.]